MEVIPVFIPPMPPIDPQNPEDELPAYVHPNVGPFIQAVVTAAQAPQGEQPAAGPRRILVDPANPNEVAPDARRPQIPQNIELKTRVTLFIAATHYQIGYHMLGRNFDPMDLNVGDQIHNILFTAHTILRQRTRRENIRLEQPGINTDYTLTTQGITFALPRAQINNMVRNAAEHYGIAYAPLAAGAANNWYSIAGPIMNFLAGFSLRKKELRLGHSRMTYQRQNNETREFSVSEYGLNGSHHVLLEGVLWPPEKKASMAQSIGPMTALLAFLRTNLPHDQKWLTAAKRAFAHFPDIDIVLRTLKNKRPEEVRELIHYMAPIALITTTRQANRVFIPPAIFSYLLTRRVVARVRNHDWSLTNVLANYNFSGHGAAVIYRAAYEYTWRMGGDEMTPEKAAQIAFHCMFGTYKEDLSLLSQITRVGNWYTRDQLGDVFRHPNQAIGVQFRLPGMLYFSKWAKANQTGMLAENYSQLSSVPCFSGTTKRKFSDAFLEAARSRTQAGLEGRSINSLVNKYQDVHQKLLRELDRNGNSINFGTTLWYDMELVTPTLVPPGLNVRFETANRFFLGRNE